MPVLLRTPIVYLPPSGSVSGCHEPSSSYNDCKFNTQKLSPRRREGATRQTEALICLRSVGGLQSWQTARSLPRRVRVPSL